LDNHELKLKLEQLNNITSKLEPSPEERQLLVDQITGYAGQFIDGLSVNKTFSTHEPDSTVFKINPETQTLSQLIHIYDVQVAKNGINAASGGHLGYIPGGGIFASSVADLLVGATNEYAGIYYASPGATLIEQSLLTWMKSIFGFPESAVGNLCSGGSIANLIALTAARDRHKIKGARIETSVVYLSEQVHHCVQKALRIIGLEDVIIRYISLDDRHRMKADELSLQIEDDISVGLNPFLVIASAGTTDTGAMDPLKEIGKIAQQHRMWYHIDGAYGGFFIMVDEKKDLFQGIEMADSLCIDPHKSMFIPYGLGAVLIKDREAVYHSHHYRANYMQDSELDGIPDNAADVSPELTKHFRGMRMWLPLQMYGAETFAACLNEKVLLIHYMRGELLRHGFEVGPEPDLTVSYFWMKSKEGDENDLNRRLLEEIHKDGRVYLSSTVINGRFVIRIAIVSFRTKIEEVEKAMNCICRARDIVQRQ
jgi:glutamate/tyrosine decarboxylase-like PLP-dependent enzyme